MSEPSVRTTPLTCGCQASVATSSFHLFVPGRESSVVIFAIASDKNCRFMSQSCDGRGGRQSNIRLFVIKLLQMNANVRVTNRSDVLASGSSFALAESRRDEHHSADDHSRIEREQDTALVLTVAVFTL